MYYFINVSCIDILVEVKINIQMCGILGSISLLPTVINIDSVIPLLKHRGPDSQQTFYDKNDDVNVSLGHARLSIIDLNQNSNQPFHSSCDKYAIVFNGEIYNYLELKDKLTNSSVLVTNSDTEVLLALYIEYGPEMLSWLNGMFAFTIYDKQKKEFFSARDPLGIKPYYYYLDDKKYAFCSEIKPLFQIPGIEKKMDNSAITEFLLNGFLYEPDTGFLNIKKLYPGHYSIVKEEENALSISNHMYWKPAKKIMTTSLPDLINKSVKDHLISDVPVGLFFSGGIDSSIILSQVKNTCRLFTVKSSDKEIKESGNSNDYKYAKEIADKFGRELDDIKLNDSDLDILEWITHIASKVEEPIADFTFKASQQLSQSAKQKDYKVILSGMGADEIFGGYPRYTLVRYSFLFKLIKPFTNLLKRLPRFNKKIERFNSFFNADSFIMKYTSLVGYFSTEDVNELMLTKPNLDRYKSKLNSILKDYSNETVLKKALILDLYGFLSHNFMVADKSSMQESIEIRVPLATHALYDYAFNLEDKKLLSLTKTKVLLKQYLQKYLPDNLIYRKKGGFNPPLDTAINKLGRNKIFAFFKENKLFDCVSEEKVQLILSQHFAGAKNNTYKIYSLLFLSAWVNQF